MENLRFNLSNLWVFFREYVLNIALTRSILAQNAPNTVWQPGSSRSARTRWEITALPRLHLAGLRGATYKGSDMGREGKEGRERKEREERGGQGTGAGEGPSFYGS